MIDNILDRNLMTDEDFFIPFILGADSTLLVQDEVQVQLTGAKSFLAYLGAGSRVSVGMRAIIDTMDSVFQSSADHVSVWIGDRATIHSLQGPAIALKGSGNTIHLGQYSSVDYNNGIWTQGSTIVSGGHSSITLEHGSSVNFRGRTSTGIELTGGGNTLSLAGNVMGTEVGISIAGGNNLISIPYPGYVTSRNGPALHLMNGQAGERNFVQLTAGGTLQTYYGATALLSEGEASDTVYNGERGVWAAFIHGSVSLGGGDDYLYNAKYSRITDNILNPSNEPVIKMGSGNDKVVNDGTITGDTSLGTCDDVFENTDIGIAGTIFGNGGNDTILGGRNYEKMSGGAGEDFLVGGLGEDMFIFDAPLGPDNVDVIGDFEAGLDTIHLSNQIFNTLAIGQLNDGAFQVGSRAETQSVRILYNDETGYLSYDPDGSGAAAASAFAFVDRNLPLEANSIFIFGAGTILA